MQIVIEYSQVFIKAIIIDMQILFITIIDIKDMDPAIYSAYTGRDNSLVLSNLRILAEQGLADKCVVRIPLIPGFNTQEDVARSEAEVRSLGFGRIDKFEYNIDYATRKRNLQNA